MPSRPSSKIVESRVDRRRTDTRQRIQRIALELFAEQGYERTSLREIAERLQVTKAALYYHFKTKEDILRGAIQDLAWSVDELVAWGRAQPRTAETRRELLRRYALVLRGQWRYLVQFLQENQPAMRELDMGSQLAGQFNGIVELLRDSEGGLPEQFRAFLAVVVLHLGAMGSQQGGPLAAMGLNAPGTDDEVAGAALDVAVDLVSRPGRQ